MPFFSPNCLASEWYLTLNAQIVLWLSNRLVNISHLNFPTRYYEWLAEGLHTTIYIQHLLLSMVLYLSAQLSRSRRAGPPFFYYPNFFQPIPAKYTHVCTIHTRMSSCYPHVHINTYYNRINITTTYYEYYGTDYVQYCQLGKAPIGLLFTIKTNMPIPVLVYGDAFQWAKYGHHILPSNLDLTSHHKTGIHQLFWNCLIEFLRTDLDGNLVPSSQDLTSHNKAGLHQTFQKSLVEFLRTDFLIEFLRTDSDGNLSFTLNPLTASIIFYHHCLRDYQKLQMKMTKSVINMCGIKKESIALSIR